MHTSLVVQWLSCHASTAGAKVQSLGGELRFHVPHSQKTEEKEKLNESTTIRNKIQDVFIIPGSLVPVHPLSLHPAATIVWLLITIVWLCYFLDFIKIRSRHMDLILWGVWLLLLNVRFLTFIKATAYVSSFFLLFLVVIELYFTLHIWMHVCAR